MRITGLLCNIVKRLARLSRVYIIYPQPLSVIIAAVKKYLKIALFFACLSLLAVFFHRDQANGLAPQNYLTYMPVIESNKPTWIGPDGGSVVAMVVNPLTPEIIYAGTWGAGVYKSMDSGVSWQGASQGLGNLFINSMAIDPQHPEIVYAGTYKSGIYRTSDAGSSWYPVNNGIQEQAIVYSLAVNPNSSNLVLASTRGASNNGSNPWNGVLYISKDGGNSWSPSLNNIGGDNQQDWIYSINFDRADPNLVYAAAHQYGIFRSSDSGASWQRAITGLDDWSGRAVASDPVNNIVYSGYWHTGGIQKSSDHGDHWTTANSSIGGMKIYSLTVDPVQPKTIFLGTFSAGLIRTADGFTHFNAVGPQGDKFYTIAVNPKNNQDVYTGTVGDGIWASHDNGQTWSFSSQGLKTTSAVSVQFNQGQIYSGIFGEGVLTMPVTGTAWSQSNLNLPDRFLNGLVQNPAHPNILYALTEYSGLFSKDINSTSGWTYLGNNLPPALAFLNPSISSQTNNLPGYLDPEELFDSQPDTPTANQLDALLDMAIAPSNPNTMYLGLRNSGMYVSLDGGASWNSSELKSRAISSLAVDPRDDKKIYAAGSGSNVVFYSDDRGHNWAQIYTPASWVNRVVLCPNNPDLLYIGTNNGLYRRNMSTGEDWTLVGLISESVISIAFYPDQPDHIFAGTENGVYQSYDAGITWTAAPSMLQGISVQTIAFDPDRPGSTYFGTKTRGILQMYIH